MASSSKSKKIYDVFLSFRGVDLRNNFVAHLYQALCQNGIYTFRDSEELQKGDQISPALMKVIEESCIAIIVFSKDYASSRWCLEEMTKITECMEQRELVVFPVFYKVEPREVRGCKESYGRALAKHNSKFGKDSEDVKRWKKALFKAGRLCGWHLNDGDESEHIQEIVKNISTYLARTPLHVAKHPVGMESRVVKLKLMLNLESNYGVLMVGLWGHGGIGKTSLAKALCNAIFKQFEGSCFLANVRETSKDSRGLVTLQEILLNDILLPQRRLEVSNVDGGIHLIQRRLGHKKVLLILDDVDDLCQLNALAGESNWFGDGSRIIITTRNKQLLTCHRIDQDHVYEVEPLDRSEARELLRQHTFQAHQIRTELVNRVLNYSKGLPLALEVLGSLLCGTGEDVWESTLKKLSRNPDKTINNVLIVSFDGLDENEKEIFLHITCFFKGWAKDYVKKVLDSCDLQTAVGFDILIKRSLIKIEGGYLQVHDLIQAMGIDIVNQECRDDPGKRSRLWSYDDVVDVLSHDVGDYAVKSIVLDLLEPTRICIRPDAFTKMRRLRLVILRNVRDSFQGNICLPNELRWFEWPGCAGRIPEFSRPKKLVGLDMGEGIVRGVVKQFKDFQQLKYINFSFCESLVRMPDLSCTPNLRELVIRNCKNMVEAHESIAYHEKLEVLNLGGCSQLSVFPKVLKSKNLRHLDVADCKNFERFPDIPYELEGLKSLYLGGTAIKELPASIENLISLERMCLYDCKNLVSLPSSIYKLQNMKELKLQGCTALIGFPKYEDSVDPSMKTGLSSLQWLDLRGCNLFEVEFLENLSCFPLLEYLDLSRNNITFLPTSINKRDHLSRLGVADCYQLQEIPQLPPHLYYFSAYNCESLQKTEDCISPHAFVRRALNKHFQVYCECSIYLPGGEMPEWFLPIEEGSVSFEASKDLYNKFFGLALCFILDEQHEPPLPPQFTLSSVIDIESYVNGQLQKNFHWKVYSLDSDHIWFQLYEPSKMLGAVNFDQSDGGYVQFRITASCEYMKKWGFRILCKQLDNVLKVEIQDNQLMDPALLYEVGHDSTGSEAQSSHKHENSPIETNLHEDLQDCQMRTDEHSRTVSERNHKLFPLQAWEQGPCGLLIQLAEMSIAALARCFCC